MAFWETRAERNLLRGGGGIKILNVTVWFLSLFIIDEYNCRYPQLKSSLTRNGHHEHSNGANCAIEYYNCG